MKRYLFLILLILFLACPQPAWANAGTALMWATMLHLVFGNALIGVGEGLLLAWLCALPRLSSVGVMILANYASAWLGGLGICGLLVRVLPMDLNNGWLWFWVLVVVAYAVTIPLEWPFIAWCLRGRPHVLRRSLRASVIVQSASYVLLFAWYWMASGTSLYTQMTIVAPTTLALPPAVYVYFIDPADGDVYRRPLALDPVQRVAALHAQGSNDRLFMQPRPDDPRLFDLMARLDAPDRNPRSARFVPVLPGLSNIVVPERPRSLTGPTKEEGTWFTLGSASRLGSAASSSWEFWAGFWPAEGLTASNSSTGERVHFSYETPFGAWAVRNLVHLPSDTVLFQLGDDQICIFDPVRRQVALLWHGRGPVPVIDDGNARSGQGRAGQPVAAPVTNRSAATGSSR
jgi:hypothetical protein